MQKATFEIVINMQQYHLYHNETFIEKFPVNL